MTRWIAALLAAAVFLMPLEARAEFDRKQFCRSDADEVIVLIDITTALDDRARQLLNDGVRTVIDGLDPGGMLRVATITDQVTTSNQLIAECVPYCPTSLIDILFSECTEGLLRKERRRLNGLIQDALRAHLRNTVDLPWSDIVRTVSASARVRDPDRHLELYIFSDLIENSPFISGKEFWGLKTSSLLARISENQLVPDLSNATVRAFGVGRAGTGDRKALPQALMTSLTTFWTAYFNAAGTTDVTLSEYLARR